MRSESSNARMLLNTTPARSLQVRWTSTRPATLVRGVPSGMPARRNPGTPAARHRNRGSSFRWPPSTVIHVIPSRITSSYESGLDLIDLYASVRHVMTYYRSFRTDRSLQGRKYQGISYIITVIWCPTPNILYTEATAKSPDRQGCITDFAHASSSDQTHCKICGL